MSFLFLGGVYVYAYVYVCMYVCTKTWDEDVEWIQSMHVFMRPTCELN